MVDVVVLGSGTPVPDPERAGASVAVVAGDEWVLVDCGRAATQRALAAGLALTSLAAVAITHHHSDHLSDLATLATARWTAGASPLVVVAPEGPAAAFARDCLEAFDDGSFFGQAPRRAGRRPVIEVRSFDASGEVPGAWASGAWRLSSAPVQHRPVEPAVGYLVACQGARVAISGDTAACEGMRRLARDADVLVHEALLSSRVPPVLLDGNASARSVGALAADARVRALVLTHLIPAPATGDDERAYLDEARAGGFDGPTLVARDLLRLPIDAPADAPARSGAP